MNTRMIDASMVARMFLSGAKNLEAKKEWINELNVFPVPDGDTGTNMTLTILSAAGEVGKILPDPNMESLCKAISSGSLRGARGNSGVILSQLLRGFTRVISKYKELDAPVIAKALRSGVDTAYKAVMKPKEGTILTVARSVADTAEELCQSAENLAEFFEEILKNAEITLAGTPDLLPVLKEAGVVDSGGQGLVEVLRGVLDGFLGKEIDYSNFEHHSQGAPLVRPETGSEEEIRFGYCTEFIILLEKPLPDSEVASFKEFLNSLGDSIVLVADDDLVKVHVHTNHPGEAIEKALTYGALSRMKIDNMREEHQEKLFKDSERLAKEQLEEQKKAEEEKKTLKENGFIAVSVGEGLSSILKELGVDFIIEGGQTMNPSTDDIMNAIAQVNAKTIYVLPNNKNIILAANQARDLTEDKEIIVIPTTSIPQCVSAMISFDPLAGAEGNQEAMREAISQVRTGQVTYAVRDTRMNEKDIHEGDMMGLGDHGILSVGSDVMQVAKDLVEALIDESSEVISVYYGEDIKEEEAQNLLSYLEDTYPDCEIELNYGGQPIYYYIVSVE